MEWDLRADRDARSLHEALHAHTVNYECTFAAEMSNYDSNGGDCGSHHDYS